MQYVLENVKPDRSILSPQRMAKKPGFLARHYQASELAWLTTS
jgi:hypothetical protein